MKNGRSISARIASAVLSLSLGIVAFPKIQGEKTVRAAAWEKTQENTRIGVSKMADPVEPDYAENPWYGSYVYYGKYNDSPILFRVLDTDATDFHTNPTLLLDSDKILTTECFDDTSNKSNDWEYCTLRGWLNGVFLNQFTSIEEHAIAYSNASSRAQTFPNDAVGNYVSLYYDQVFLLDYDDVMNKKYGYYPDNSFNPSVNNRVKYDLTGKEYYWWLRTQRQNTTGNGALVVGKSGNFDPYVFLVQYPNGVAPAMNIDTNWIAFSSAVEGKYGALGTEYKLTVFDNGIFLQSPSNERVVMLGNNQYSVPYEITGSNAGEVNRLSLLITVRPIR